MNMNRKYPSYTLAQLESFVANGRGNAAMIEEINARKNGASKVLVVPQIEGGMVQPRLGRM